jgi:hypothetical protein
VADDESDAAIRELLEHNARRRAGRSTRLRTALAAVVVALLGVALVAGVVKLIRNDDVQAPPPLVTAAPVATLRVAAPRGDASVLIRRDGPQGHVLFRGTLKVGQSITVRAQLFWVRLDPAGDVDLSVDGRHVSAAGSGRAELVVTHAGIVG